MASHSIAFRFTLAVGLSGLMWGIHTIVAPDVAQAVVARVDLALDRLPNESFDSLARRAELAARAAVQRSFDKNILTSNSSVIVTGRVSGSEAPILSINVSREQWRTQPDPRRWATYYKSAKLLLDFGTMGGGVSSPAASSPVALPVPEVAPPSLKPASRSSAPLPVVNPAESVNRKRAELQKARSQGEAEAVPSQTPLPPPQLPQ